MPLDQPSAVLFDVDGTLVDSNYLHVQAWIRAFHAIERPVSAWRIHRCIGMDSARLLAELLGGEASELGDAVKKQHAGFYSETVPLLAPLPGARDLLHELATRDVRIVLATSAPSDELELLRSILDVDELITATTNADDVETAKPEPDIVNIAKYRSGCPSGRVVFVGDSVWDMQAAARAGVGRIGLRSGGIGADELRDAGADEIYNDPVELLAKLRGSRLADLL